jgi:hypothetical protein
VLAPVGLAALFGVLAIAAGVRYAVVVSGQTAYFSTAQDQGEMEAYMVEMQISYALYVVVPWLTMAALLAAVVALALAARRAQLAGSASATASRVASSAASVSAGSAESIS